MISSINLLNQFSIYQPLTLHPFQKALLMMTIIRLKKTLLNFLSLNLPLLNRILILLSKSLLQRLMRKLIQKNLPSNLMMFIPILTKNPFQNLGTDLLWMKFLSRNGEIYSIFGWQSHRTNQEIHWQRFILDSLPGFKVAFLNIVLALVLTDNK